MSDHLPSFTPSILSFFFFLPWLLFRPSRPCWSTVSESTMIFYNLFFLMLLTFQIVDALPLHARRQRLHGQPCRQPDHLEGLFEDIIDRQHDHRIDRQIDRQPDEPPPGHGSDQPPTQLEPPQLPPSQPTIAHPQEATIRPLNLYV